MKNKKSRSLKFQKNQFAFCIFKLIALLLFFCSPGHSEVVDEKIEGTFGKWLKVCNSKTSNCVGVAFAENEAGKKVARFVIDRRQTSNNAVKAVGTLLIPYDFALPHLPSGSILMVDKNESIKEKFLFCDLNGCTVRFMFTELGIKLLKEGSNILIKIRDVRSPRPARNMDIPLDGLKSLYSSLGNNNSSAD